MRLAGTVICLTNQERNEGRKEVGRIVASWAFEGFLISEVEYVVCTGWL